MLHPEWRTLLDAEVDFSSLLPLADEHFHEPFHLLVVETFEKVGMTVQDLDSGEFIQIVDETREQIQLLKQLE